MCVWWCVNPQDARLNLNKYRWICSWNAELCHFPSVSPSFKFYAIRVVIKVMWFQPYYMLVKIKHKIMQWRHSIFQTKSRCSECFKFMRQHRQCLETWWLIVFVVEMQQSHHSNTSRLLWPSQSKTVWEKDSSTESCHLGLIILICGSWPRHLIQISNGLIKFSALGFLRSKYKIWILSSLKHQNTIAPPVNWPVDALTHIILAVKPLAGKASLISNACKSWLLGWLIVQFSILQYADRIQFQ